MNSEQPGAARSRAPGGVLRHVLPFLLFACSDGGDGIDETSGSPKGASDSGSEIGSDRAAGELRGPFRFTDVTAESGLGTFVQVQDDAEKHLILGAIGAGVGLFDYDQDGDLDAWLVNGGRLDAQPDDPPLLDGVFANDGSGRFSDVTEALGVAESGFTSGVRIADVDGDGWRDAYLTNWGANSFYRNVEGARFVEEGRQRGMDDPVWSTGAVFFDADRDGDLDLYVVNHVKFDADWIRDNRPMAEYRGVEVYFGPRGLEGEADRFLLNDGSANFQDVSAEFGIGEADAFGFQAVAFDSDDDGWLDVYVANDSVPNYLWRNLEGAGFEDVAFLSGAALSMNGTNQAGMGVAVGDWDGDLDLDLYVTNFAEDYYTLYRNDGGGIFSDVTRRMQMVTSTYPYLGWGCGIVDFDADGDLDVYAVNGHVYPQVDQFDLGTRYRQRSLLFENEGQGRFADPAGVGGEGFAVLGSSRGSAVGDIDGDGDLDVLIGNLDEPPTLLRNDTPNATRGVHVRLIGRSPNTEAVGARAVGTFQSGGRATRVLQVAGTGGSFLSSDSPWLFFGLGDAEKLDSLEVTWPDGSTSKFGPYSVGHRVTLRRE